MTLRGVGVGMGYGESLQPLLAAPPFLPLLPVLALDVPWATGVSVLQLRWCLRGTSALGLQPLLPSSFSRPPLWGPSAAAPSLDASGTSPPLLSISVALNGVPGPFWASENPCQPQHCWLCARASHHIGLSQTLDTRSSGNEELKAALGQEDLTELVGGFCSLPET